MIDFIHLSSLILGVLLGALGAVAVRAYWDEFREIEEAIKWE